MTKKYKYLDEVNFPSDLKKLSHSEIKILAQEVREEMIDAVSETALIISFLTSSANFFKSFRESFFISDGIFMLSKKLYLLLTYFFLRYIQLYSLNLLLYFQIYLNF